MKLIDGKAVAAEIKKELPKKSRRMKAEGAKTPHLATVLVGARWCERNVCGQ